MNHNTAEVAKLQPDYLGFIFYEKSPRNFIGQIPEIPSSTKRVGVFVNNSLSFISEKIKTYKLDVVQLHGDESPEFCNNVRSLQFRFPSKMEVWKVFSIKDTFNFKLLEPYEANVNKFLFDTKGKEKGGNGIKFNWKVFNDYHSKKPFILSGGIGSEVTEELITILKTKLPIYAIDINSKFEITPGLKDITKLNEFMSSLKHFTTKKNHE